MSPASVTPAKRILKDANGTGGGTGATKTKKARKIDPASVARAKDVEAIRSIVGDIRDPAIKAALEGIIRSPTGQVAVVFGSPPTAVPKKDEATLQRMTDKTIRAVQNQISAKLQWKGSFKQLTGDNKRGARVEAACNDPEVFERIFKGATIKRGKDGKLSCSIKTEEEMAFRLPFEGKKYRYNRSYLSAPYSASLKDGTLTFSFKFGL